MKKKILLNITVGEEGRLDVKMPDSNLALDAIVSLILGNFSRGETEPMTFLLSLTANVLAQEASGKLQEEFIAALEEYIPKCREHYRLFLLEERNCIS